MSEILRCEFNATTQSLLVTIDEVREGVVDTVDGKPVMGLVPVAGGSNPQVRWTFDELFKADPEIALEYSMLMSRLEPLTRAKYARESDDPAKIKEAFASHARAQEALAQERADHNAAAERRRQELAALDALLEAKRAAAESAPSE
jgi:hypothetical protein